MSALLKTSRYRASKTLSGMCGFFQLLGAIQSGRVVCGPKETKIPPDPIYKDIKEAQELIAIGSIFWENDFPKVHLHAALGRGDNTVLGCIREAAKTFITLEVLVQEIIGVLLYQLAIMSPS